MVAFDHILLISLEVRQTQNWNYVKFSPDLLLFWALKFTKGQIKFARANFYTWMIY